MTRGSGPRTPGPLFIRSRKNFRRNRLFGTSYLRLFNDHVAEFNAEEEVLSHGMHHALHGSVVKGVNWSAAEKELFFKCLSRHGKSQVERISTELGTKSVLEVAGYLETLRCAYESLRRTACLERASSDSWGLIPYVKLPIAVEVGDVFLHAEEEAAAKLCRLVETRYHVLQSRKLGWSVIDRESALSIDADVREMPPDQGDMFYRISPELVTMNTHLMLSLARSLREENVITYRETITDLYGITVRLTRKLIQTSQVLAKSRISVEQTSYLKRFKGRLEVSDLDISSACDILRIPHSSRIYWQSLLEDSPADANSQPSDAEDEEQEYSSDEEEALQILEAHDLSQSITEESRIRPFVGLLPLPTPSPIFATDLSKVDKYGWSDEYTDIY